MRAAIFALVLFVAACERTAEGAIDHPEPPDAALTSSTEGPPEKTPPDRVTPCTTLPPEMAAGVMTSLPAVVDALGWTVHGSALTCAMPDAEGAVACMLAAGGTAVATQANKTYGFRNDTAAPVSITVGSEGMSCGPLKSLPSPS
ncbi:MAG TPA: hypothetical protein VFV70_12550 [Hyphomonadaceae bacterium]|nr:hypothetical protein [Hyphomonadaceae bacterium]